MKSPGAGFDPRPIDPGHEHSKNRHLGLPARSTADTRLGLSRGFVVCIALSVLVIGCGARPGASGQHSVAAADLVKVAAHIYPFEGGRYVSCDNGRSGPTRYSNCPLTARLNDRLLTVFSGFISAPEPLGGGQDPEWAAESATAEPTGTGGVVHVSLAKPNETGSRYDLVVILSKGQLVVDDIYCTGADPTTSSIYVPGWMNRFHC